METVEAEVLPYRSDPEQLARWIEARARGRSSAQLRELDLAAKTLEGTLATAAALGLLHRDSEQLTPAGQRYALAAEAERHAILRASLRAFEPFSRLLDAVSARSPRRVTDAQWIETWWATHGYGSSQSNRVEATAVFGRLVDYVGWGRYIPGRRGHPTRIEWSAEAFPEAEPVPPSPAAAPTAAPAAAPLPELPGPTAPPPPPAEAVDPEAARVPAAHAEDGYNRIVVPLRSGEVARLQVPRRLPREEKRRLVELLELLISEEPSGS